MRLPDLPLQYRDFATAQRAAAAAGEYDGQLDWWAGRLDPGALGLAAAVPRDVSGYTGVRYRLVVPAAVADRLRRLRTTMFLTLLTALSGALAQRTETGDVAVASMVAGRRRPEHRRLVGMVADQPPVLRPAPAGDHARDRDVAGLGPLGQRPGQRGERREEHRRPQPAQPVGHRRRHDQPVADAGVAGHVPGHRGGQPERAGVEPAGPPVELAVVLAGGRGGALRGGEVPVLQRQVRQPHRPPGDRPARTPPRARSAAGRSTTRRRSRGRR